MLIVVAPSAITASSTRHRKSGSRAVAVLRRELDVVAQVAREAHRQPGLLEHLLGRHAQLLLHVQRRLVAMKVWMRDARRALQRLGGARDVAVVGARQRADGGVLDRVGDRLDGLEVAVATTRRSRPRSRRPAAARAGARCAASRPCVIEAPGDCSPSRKVVSKMISLSVLMVRAFVGGSRAERKRPAAVMLAGRRWEKTGT